MQKDGKKRNPNQLMIRGKEGKRRRDQNRNEEEEERHETKIEQGRGKESINPI